jgi:hypothetical protein
MGCSEKQNGAGPILKDKECLRRPPENFGFPIYFGIYAECYFVGAGVAEGAGVVAFLCFFTAFLPVVAVLVEELVAGAGVVAGAAGVWAIEIPAVASASENPKMVEVIFFMMF